MAVQLEEPSLVTESGHHIWDSMAIEAETGELLCALVRASKPDLILESGTGRGFGTFFLLSGIAQNGKGRVITFEPDPMFREIAQERFSRIGDNLLEFRSGDSSQYTELSPDLVFVDCYGPYREPVIRRWLTDVSRPLVVVHDAHRDYPFHLGEGVHIPGHDGVWIGRAKEQ